MNSLERNLKLVYQCNNMSYDERLNKVNFVANTAVIDTSTWSQVTFVLQKKKTFFYYNSKILKLNCQFLKETDVYRQFHWR